jgi:integrase
MNWATVRPTERKALRQLYEQHCENYHLAPRQRERYLTGLDLLLAWLRPGPGQSWQEVWELRAECAGAWTQLTGAQPQEGRTCLYKAAQVLIAYRVVRPGYRWLLDYGLGDLYQLLFDTTEREARRELRRAAHELGLGAHALSQVWRLVGRVLAHTGKPLREVTADDLLELRAATRGTGHVLCGHFTVTRLLFHLGIVKEPLLSPSYFRTERPTIEQLVDSFGIRNVEVRRAFVLYLKERAPALDFNSLRQLAYRIVKLFWRDIEERHPEVTSLNIPAEVMEAWKRRLRVLPGGKPRLEVVAILFHIRSFYLDILQWSQTRPEVWASYACPCPVRESDLAANRKSVMQQKARTHARIRLMQPLLARFVAHVRARRVETKRLLDTALGCAEGDGFELDGARYERLRNRLNEEKRMGTLVPVIVRALDQPDAPKIHCRMREDRAFWAWAVTEVLRLTGLRCEELTELTHLSIRDHTTAEGQRVLLLQVAPSKQDRERVLPVCPELAHALAQIIKRARGQAPSIPCIPRYDPLERTVGAPLPYLFQGGPKRQRGVFSREHVRTLLRDASRELGLRDHDGTSVVFQAHDFRRLFATEAVNGGLPLHIAAKLLGHSHLNTTRGYVAVYEDEIVRHYQTYLARRRAFRPPHEYREPTDAEWSEFARHFRRRKMALGDCYRPYGTDCPHEHACVRCPMLRMDVEQLPRLIQIEADTHRLLDEAKRKGWEGEAAGLETTLVHIKDKKAQVERLRGADASFLTASSPSQTQSAGRGRACGTRRRAAAGRG